MFLAVRWQRNMLRHECHHLQSIFFNFSPHISLGNPEGVNIRHKAMLSQGVVDNDVNCFWRWRPRLHYLRHMTPHTITHSSIQSKAARVLAPVPTPTRSSIHSTQQFPFPREMFPFPPRSRTTSTRTCPTPTITLQHTNMNTSLFELYLYILYFDLPYLAYMATVF